MANPEDFEIIPDEQSHAAPRNRGGRWLWVGGALLLFIFAFAVGVGWTTLADRLGGGATTEAPIAAVTSQPAPAGNSTTVAGALQTATAASATAASGAATAAVTPATPAPPANTPAPAPPPTQPPPTRVCAVPLDPQFVPLFDPGVLGCPVAPTSVIWAAYEGFERGAMVWRSDTNLSYILYGDGTWSTANEMWSGQEPPWRGDPPAGLFRPERGFGYIWGVRDDLFTRLGWATMPEKGFCAAVQSFEQGFALASAPVASCTADNLYNHAVDADWRPLLMSFDNTGRWRAGLAAGAPAPNPPAPAATLVRTPTAGNGATVTPAVTPAVTSTGAPVADVSMRPASQGLFTARRGQPSLLDGRFDDWPGPWQPISAVIQGRDQWTGPTDLYGAFQALWAPEGLYLAVQVNDDVLRAGPEGSDQWQGDGVEIQLDRRLADDFTDTRANDDDTQLGLAPDRDFINVRGYRWLPLAAESRFSPSGAVVAAPGQYALEVLIPWLYFDLGAGQVQPDLRLGFNLSVNDNDGDTPALQSVISASPARTTHDNPTEWGTLVLGN